MLRIGSLLVVLSCLSAVGLSTSPSVKSLVSIAESDVRKVLAHANPEVAKACIDTALASHLIPRFSALFVSAFYYDEVQEQVEASRAYLPDPLVDILSYRIIWIAFPQLVVVSVFAWPLLSSQTFLFVLILAVNVAAFVSECQQAYWLLAAKVCGRKDRRTTAAANTAFFRLCLQPLLLTGLFHAMRFILHRLPGDVTYVVLLLLLLLSVTDSLSSVLTSIRSTARKRDVKSE